MQIPNISDKNEWKLNGQMVSVDLALTDAVSLLKTKLQEETGMPPAKQKISFEVIEFVFFFLMFTKVINCYRLVHYRECSLKIAIQWLFIIY